MNKHKRTIVILVSILAVLSSIFLFNKRTEAKTLEQVDVIVADIAALFSDDSKTMLADDVTMGQVIAIEEDIEEFENSDKLTPEADEILSVAKEDLNDAKEMVDLRDSANALIDEEGRLVEDSDIASVQAKADSLAEKKPEFVASIQPIITEAQNQANAVALTNALFTDETRQTVRDDVTRDEYDSAKNAVELITYEMQKTELQTSLEMVNQFLTEQEELAKVEESSNSNNIKTVSNPSDILVLVNKQNALPMDYVPADLVVPDVPMAFSDTSLDKAHLRVEAATALEDLFAAAEADGMELTMVSGYRSAERQEELFEEEVAKDGSEEEAAMTVARPGTSEHQTGLAVDVSSPNYDNQLNTGFGETPEGTWLAKHAHEYGFIIRYEEDKTHITGYSYEPWHLRYVGVEAATTIYEKDMCLETYLGY